MKRILFLPLLYWPFFCLFAQEIEPQIIGAAGDSYQGASMQIDWTIGEPLITSFENETILLSQGFHQPTVILTNTSELPVNINFVNIYPNPAIDNINVTIDFAQDQVIELIIYNIKGQKLSLKKCAGSSIAETLNLSNYSPGFYNITFALDAVNYVYPFTIQKK